MPVSRRSRYGPHSASSHNLPTQLPSVNSSGCLASQVYSEPDLGALTKEQLKAECRRRGQKTNGTKAELLQRLGHKMTSPQSLKSGAKVHARNGDAPNAKSNISSGTSMSSSQIEKLKQERESLTVWKRPITTLKYAALEMVLTIQSYGSKIIQHKKTMITVVSLLLAILVLSHVKSEEPAIIATKFLLTWMLYWIGLGVLSSVGLGTGLHTFLLYLGPHIAAVTIAAYECGALNFPAPPYPSEIICPTELDPNYLTSIWNIMSKVRFEAFLWGVGTALGELPPYYIARSARLSGCDPDDDEDIAEFEELQRMKKQGANLNMVQRLKLGVERLVEKVGFFGILACASVPNPLFDLAGITCGHFLVPFWTFFGATLIGKAIIKMHFQKIFVIIAFSETYVTKIVGLLQYLPLIGPLLQQPFLEFLESQKRSFHRNASDPIPESSKTLIGYIIDKFIICIILFFIISIINSFAKYYHKRIHKKQAPKRKVARD